MEPLYGFFLYLALTALCAMIATKRGRSGGRYLATLLILPIPIIMATSWALGDAPNKGYYMAWAAFACPLIGLLSTFFIDSGAEVAATKGDYGDYRRCPYCAESVRREAIKCRHCHSKLIAKL